MFLPRLIPVLLLKGKGLVKTIKFKDPSYIGDPINAVKIFNDLKADELILLDIMASKENRCIDFNLVKDIGDEAFMPFGVGGGISNLEQIEQLLKFGAEKVIINTNAILNPDLIKNASNHFGSQSIVVCLDVKKSLFGKYELFIKGGSVNTHLNLLDTAKKMEDLGAGELIINSIDNDGTLKGYDIQAIRLLSENLAIPIVCLGGAWTLEHLRQAYFEGKAHALAAGSFFVYHGPRRAVLINYPTKVEIKNIFYDSRS